MEESGRDGEKRRCESDTWIGGLQHPPPKSNLEPFRLRTNALSTEVNQQGRAQVLVHTGTLAALGFTAWLPERPESRAKEAGQAQRRPEESPWRAPEVPVVTAKQKGLQIFPFEAGEGKPNEM